VVSELVVVGVTHRTAPVEVRERLAISDEGRETLLRDLVRRPAIREAVLLSTCNRMEVVACCPEGVDPSSELQDTLFALGGLDSVEHRDSVFTLRGREALRHIFRVAASLDSLVVGEPQILGQLKEQFALAAALSTAGPVLHRVFHKGFSVAKRVRHETGVAGRSVSIASVAVTLARKIFESLEGRSVMLIGVGEIGEAAARAFAAAGAARVMVANRTFEPAVELARVLGGTPVPFERMTMYLPLADLVVGSAGGGVMLTRDEVKRAMRERLRRPVFFIDLAVPRNFDAKINEIDNSYLYDIDDLTAVVEENLGERRRDAVHGEVIVEEEVERFWRWFEKLDIVPTIVELRDRAERMRSEEVARTLAKMPSLDDEERERIEQMTRAIVNKLLHHPTCVLKEGRRAAEEFVLLEAARDLFGLEKKKEGEQ
jgi:glutamyl-tRNA reductase